MTVRTIRLRLTQAQYEELASAVDQSREDLLNHIGHDGGYAARRLATLDRAWDRLRHAWWERERRR